MFGGNKKLGFKAVADAVQQVPAKAQYDKERRAQNAAAAAAAAASASSPASSSPAAASPAAASPGAGVDIRSLEDEDGYHIGDLLQQNKSRDDIKARMAAATVAKKAKAAAKRAAAALPAPGTRRSPACCSRFPPLTII